MVLVSFNKRSSKMAPTVQGPCRSGEDEPHWCSKPDVWGLCLRPVLKVGMPDVWYKPFNLLGEVQGWVPS